VERGVQSLKYFAYFAAIHPIPLFLFVSRFFDLPNEMI